MPAQIDATLDDLRLAWQRYKRDLRDRCFVDHPFLEQWIESDLDAWLSKIATELKQGYCPRSSKHCAVPKPGFMIRPGTVLEPEDAVVYTHLVATFFKQLQKEVKGIDVHVDIAYQLASSASSVDWTKRSFMIWRQWREKSLAALKKGARFVVFTDITGFYDNISIQKLISEVRRIGAAADIADLLQECLRKWSHPRDEGIPQGYSASDLLAKLFMTPADRRLRQDGYIHLRYVDDMRVFCGSKLQARNAIKHLSALMYARGLTLQSGKTEILNISRARTAIDGVTETIEELNTKLAKEIQTELESSGYVSPGELLNILAAREGPPPEVLEMAFTEHFGVGSGERFDTSLFHYLLVRLGKAQSLVALAYCLQSLSARPSETAYILSDFSEVELENDELEELITYMKSSEAIYDFQLFEILRWFYQEEEEDEDVIQLARMWSRDQNRDPWLRSYAIAYLGKFGDETDLEELEHGYEAATTDVERADRVAALRRVEKGRRNAFFARVSKDGLLVERSVRTTKKS